jgi:hypothetical protein
VALDARALMKEIVASDYFCVRIREKRVGVTGFAAEVSRLGRRVDANGYGLDA